MPRLLDDRFGHARARGEGDAIPRVDALDLTGVAGPLLVRLEADRTPPGCRASFAPELASLLGIVDEPLVFDPRHSEEALIVGSAVVRPAVEEVDREQVARGGVAALAAVAEWCHEVDGLPAGAVVSAGSRLDAIRLAMHYALCDAILVGSATMAAEGLPLDGRPGWRWRAETPLGFAVLEAFRSSLAAALRATRARWQAAGILSARSAPALVVVTRAEGAAPPAWLGAPALQEGESWVLTSRSGAERIAAWRSAGIAGVPPEDAVLCASPPGEPAILDLAAVPRLLRERLDVRIAGHDGGQKTLLAFAAASALHQLNLTFVGRPAISTSHPGHRGRGFFTHPDGPSCAGPPLALLGADEDAWLAQFDARGAGLP